MEMNDDTSIGIMLTVLTGIKGAAKGVIAFLLSYLLANLLPNQAIFSGLFLFIIADLVTGSLVSNKGGGKFEWEKAKKTIYKFILYPLAVVIAHIYEQDFTTIIPMTEIVASIIGLFELKSIYTNMSTLLGYDLVGMIWEKIQRYADERINKKD